MPLGRALHVTRQIASALSRAHSLGIVHRDLKPENVMLVDRDGDPDFVKVLDFGIAKVPVGELAQSAPGGPGAQVLTQAGMVYGTPEYMAPEQALGQPVDARADLYALGIMAYEMLTGKRPFDDPSKVKLLGMHVTAPVPPMATTAPSANVPPEVEQIVLRLLAKEASERTADAKDLIDELASVASQLLAQGKLEASQVARIAPPTGNTTGSHVSHASNPASTEALPRLATPLASDMSQSTASPRLNGKFVAIGVVAAIILLFIGVSTVAFTFGGKQNVTKPTPSSSTAAGPVSGTASTTSPSGTTNATPQTPEERVAEALKLLERGDYASGIDKLKAIDADVEGRADVHEGLMTAYVATHRPADAMREVALLLRAKPSAADDLKVRVAVRDAAIGQEKEAADLAFKLLEDAMGQTGLDDLFDIGYGRSGQQYPEAAKRAQKALGRADLRPKMSAALQVTLDVVTAPNSCVMRKHLEQAQTDGDARTLAYLKTVKVGPKPAGFRKDPQACLRDDLLPKTIKALEARLEKH
jgi:serine/threonine-protein kinase